MEFNKIKDINILLSNIYVFTFVLIYIKGMYGTWAYIFVTLISMIIAIIIFLISKNKLFLCTGIELLILGIVILKEQMVSLVYLVPIALIISIVSRIIILRMNKEEEKHIKIYKTVSAFAILPIEIIGLVVYFIALIMALVK